MNDDITGRRLPSPAELEASRDPRIAARRLAAQERFVTLLRLARRGRADDRHATDELDGLISAAEDELNRLKTVAGGRIFPRKRPVSRSNVDTCLIFIDECGQHSLASKDPFGAFVLAAVIVRGNAYAGLDHRWKDWKSSHLGSSEKIIHEPNVRTGNGPFWFDGDQSRRARVIESLGRCISELDFAAVACVVD